MTASTAPRPRGADLPRRAFQSTSRWGNRATFTHLRESAASKVSEFSAQESEASFIEMRRHPTANQSEFSPSESAGALQKNDNLEIAGRFFSSMMRLARAQKPRAASDLVFEFFDTRFEEGDILTCDLALQIINNVKFELLSDTILVAILAATYPIRLQLESRNALTELIRKHLTITNGAEETDFIINSYR
ncbi:MAG: hypothetical protein ACRC8S_09255 [Fimbriiglobus sp.]